MKLRVLGSNSAGNCYLLESEGEVLIIEAGVRFASIKQALNFNLNRVAGCIITHEHKDHCCSVKDVLLAGINVYATAGTIEAVGLRSHRLKTIQAGVRFTVGAFEVKAFDIKHDCAEPVGFLIKHVECGTVLFLTDSYYVRYTFQGLNNIIIEANYCQDILDDKMAAGVSHEHYRNRVLQSHMSLETCKAFLKANDLRGVNNIVLIHLSDSNSDAERFRNEVRDLTNKNVTIAAKGVCIPFNTTPI